MKLFVYGTLKREYFWHDSYLKSDSKFIGKATTGREFSLYVPNLPFMVREESDSGVKGELYEINEATLKDVDLLEGHPNFYKREVIIVTDENGNKHSCFAYVHPNTFKGKVEKEDEFL